MVSAESTAVKDLTVVVEVATAALINMLSRIDASDPTSAATHAHAAIVASHGEIERGLAIAVRAAASRGREVGAAHAAAQLAEADWMLRTYEIPTSSMQALAPAIEDAVDSVRASAVSRSIASRWLLATSTNLRRWQLDGGAGSLPQVARASAAMLKPQLMRTGVTETAHAYSEEHERQVDEARAKPLPLRELLYKRWEGVLDRKICRICANHDNEVVRANDPFRFGDIPGQVHPNCRCQAVAALKSTDLNLAHAVTREVAGPGLGRAAVGGASSSGAFEDWDAWPEEAKKTWFRLLDKARTDPEYRARLLTPEIRRHLESIKAKADRHAPIVPRLRRVNPMRASLRTDARTPRAIHEEYLGRAIGAQSARFEFGELVPVKTAASRPRPPGPKSPPAAPAALQPATVTKPAPQRGTKAALSAPTGGAVELEFVHGYDEAHARTVGAAFSSALSDPAAASRNVFGGKVPSLASLEATWSGSGVRAKLTSVLVENDYIGVSGYLHDAATGARIGRVSRSFRRHPDGSLEVHHGLYKFNAEEHMGKGGGATMLKQAIQTYQRIGVKEITVDTAWIGRYAWATFGYDWDSPGRAAVKAEDFREFLIRHGVAPARASAIADRAAKHPWLIAGADVDGIEVDVEVDNGFRVTTQRLKLGKAFLLSGGMWSGKLDLDPSSESYQRAKERLGL